MTGASNPRSRNRGSTSRTLTEDEMVDAMRRDVAENRGFFSNAGKPQRERWVVGEYLTHLALSLAAKDLIPSQNKRPG